MFLQNRFEVLDPKYKQKKLKSPDKSKISRTILIAEDSKHRCEQCHNDCRTSTCVVPCKYDFLRRNNVEDWSTGKTIVCKRGIKCHELHNVDPVGYHILYRDDERGLGYAIGIITEIDDEAMMLELGIVAENLPDEGTVQRIREEYRVKSVISFSHEFRFVNPDKYLVD